MAKLCNEYPEINCKNIHRVSKKIRGGQNLTNGIYFHIPSINFKNTYLNRQVLPEHLCEKYLNISLNSQTVKFKPEILCVGHYFKWNVDVWLDKGNGIYSHVREEFI